MSKKIRKIMVALRQQYGKNYQGVRQIMKNRSKQKSVYDSLRFRDALKRGLSLDAAFGYAVAEEAKTAGTGVPLEKQLIHNCIRDAARQGIPARDALKQAVDKRLQFRGSRDGFVTGAINHATKAIEAANRSYQSAKRVSGQDDESDMDMGVEDELFSAKPSGKTERFLLGDETAFEHVERSVAAKGAHDPAALAAWIGRRSEGKKKFQAKAAAGRRAT